jgi:hypothetical protein
MSELMQAHQQWASRPADERFTSLIDMHNHFVAAKLASRETVVASRRLHALPAEDNKGLLLQGPSGATASPTNWAFGQLCGLAEAPAGYMRTLPSPIVADCVNYGLQFKRNVEDVGVLLQRNGSTEARALTGPRYGRVWNAEICEGLVERFGNGTTDSDWRVPGEFGKAITVDKDNTTLFAGDRDMFVFLADETNRVILPERRGGNEGSLARGFFVWNSEVGSATLGISTFLFDYACCNRIVWGAKQYKQVKIRHTPGAPVRWLDEVQPALQAMHTSGTHNIVLAIENARKARIDDVEDFLAKRFGKRMPAMLQDVSMEEEGHPVETLWDAATAVTAYAKRIKWQDDRVALETKAGELLDLAA